MRLIFRPLFTIAALSTFALPASAQWAPGGARVSDGSTYWVSACPSGQGGVFIGWQGWLDESDVDLNIFCHKLDAGGVRSPSFGVNGLRVTSMPGDQFLLCVVSDGAGGAFLVYGESDIYAQHVLANGSVAPGWPVGGVPVCVATGTQRDPVAFADPSGGLFLFWSDERLYPTSDQYMLRLGPDGNPAPGWPVNGRPVVGPSKSRGGPWAVGDGLGGYYFAWMENPGPPGAGSDVRLVRLTANGDVHPGWASTGNLVASGRGCRGVASDGYDGVYLLSLTFADSYGNEKNYYVHRFTGTGGIYPGWPTGGSLMCSAPVFRYGVQIISDQQGGAMLQWEDNRDPVVGQSVYAIRVGPDGNRAPGWPVDGQRVSNLNGFEEVSTMVADGAGGAYLAYNWDSPGYTAKLQHLKSDGTIAPGWPASGSILGPSAHWPSVVSDGSGGAIVAWYDNNDNHPYAQRYVSDGIVATQLALASSEAYSDRVTLVWQGVNAGSLGATVSRREENGAWRSLGAAQRDGTDRLRFEDTTVAPGTRYAYRLGWNEEGTLQSSAESWIDVPAAAKLALEGLRPNPAVGPIQVRFSLASGEAANLDLLDLAGRRVASREVGSLGAGSHLVRLDGGGRVAPGVYWVRLRTAARQLLARAVVMR